MEWKEYIVSNPAVLQGAPIIKDTRLSVELILERLENGWTEDMLLESYKTLSRQALQAVFAFSKENLQYAKHHLKTA